MLNQSIAVIFFLPLLCSIIFYTPSAPWSSPAVSSANLIIILVWIAHYKKKYALARWIGMVGFTMYISLLLVLHGRAIGGDLTYMVLGMYGMAYFPKRRDRFILFSIILLSLAGTEYYIQNYDTPYAIEINYVIKISALLGNFMTLVIIIAFLDYDQRNYVKDSEALMKQLKEKNKELEQKNIRIAVQNERLLSLNSELQDFAYATSHHFKTPLRSIHSFMGLLEKQLDPQTLRKVKDYLTYAKDSSLHLYELTQDLLAFSKLAIDGKKRTRVNLNEVIEWVCKNLNDEIQEKNVDFKLSNLPVVYGHQFHFELLFQNLIDNGIKYNHSSKPLIKIDFEQGQEHLWIKISDNGIGIADKFKEKIFDMFSRLHTPDKYEGTGLGLAICRKIVRQYNGHLSFQSNESEGTTFIIELPISIMNEEAADWGLS